MYSSLFRCASTLVLASLLAFGTACSKSHSQVAETSPTAAVVQASPTANSPGTPEAGQAENAQVYTAQRGDTVASIARRFLPQSSLMTAGELDAAIRKANGLSPKAILKPGQALAIPTLEKQPVVEKPIFVARDAEIRAVYLTGDTAGSEKGLQIIRHWQQVGGNAVVFDIKDSDGLLSVPFEHPLAPHNRRAIANLPKFVRFLHQQNMHAIARIALFRDEHIAKQHPDLAVQSRSTKGPWRENGKQVWADSSSPAVQDYNLALAKYVAGSGVDEVQFDYVRFPAEGNQADAKWYFQDKHPDWQRSDVLADFLTRTYGQLHPMGVLLSLDVFGVMAWQRHVDLAHTGQDIIRLAKVCDVLSPMIYPSHFFGMDGYKLPGDAPQHFIGMSMDRFRQVTDGTNVTLRPWLQAFGWRTRTYSAEYILKQVKTSRDTGGVGFLFWNARNDYSKPYAAMPTIIANTKDYLETAEAKQHRQEWARNYEAAQAARLTERKAVLQPASLNKEKKRRPRIRKAVLIRPATVQLHQGNSPAGADSEVPPVPPAVIGQGGATDTGTALIPQKQ